MSKNINLVEYATNNNDKLYETKYELIETVFISSDIYDKIIRWLRKIFLKKLNLKIAIQLSVLMILKW